MRSLNRLKWLHAFEAAARHGSFTGAARELGVTPPPSGNWSGRWKSGSAIRCCTAPVPVKRV